MDEIRSISELAEVHLEDLAKEDEAEIVFAVVRETKHADGSVTYQQEARVILDRKAETVCSDIAGHDLAGVISSRFAELRASLRPTTSTGQ